MPNEFDAALSHFTPDPKALAEARKKRLKKADSYEQGYREGQQIREEQERAAKLQLQEQERLDKERERAEAEQAERARKQRLAETEATYRRAGRPTFTDALGEIRPVDDDETWQRKLAEKKVAEDLKAQSRADAAFRKSEAVRLNQAETKLKAGLDDFEAAEAIGSQAVSAKASQIITLSQQIKHLSDNAVSEEDLAKLETMQQELYAARKEKETLENSERTIKVAKLNKEQELKPALGAIQQKRDILPITTAPAIPKGAGVTLQNTVSTATPAPASADPKRAAAVLRTQITVLREKGDLARADALERRLVNPAKWEAEQKAFRQTATPEQLAQTIEAGSAEIEAQWQATQQTYAVLSQQRQAYLDRMERAKAKNDSLLNQPYSDGDVAIIRDETTGDETRWHKAAAEDYNGALQGLNGWQQANQEKIDLLDLNRQQFQIEAQNLQKHENQLRYLGREQQRQQEGERATYLNNLRQTPGMAEFADEFERTEIDFNQRKAELERKYPEPQVREIASRAMQEDFSARSKDMHERIAAREKEVGSFYSDWGKDIKTDDWQTEASVTPRLQQEAAKRGMTEQQARQVLDTSRKLDWSRPLPEDAKGVRKLPDGRLSVSPTLYLEPEGYQKAVEATDANPEAKKAALAQRRDLAAPMAAEMLLDLQKVPEFAEYLAKKTSGTPVERMEQFQADLREGGALAASLQRFQGGASSLASSALGAAAAITGSDYLRKQGERFQQRAQAFETAGAEGAKGTNAVLGFGSKVIGAAPSMLGAMVPGGLLARIGQAAKLGSVAINRAALTGAALGSGAQSFGGTYLDAVQSYEKKGLSPTEAHGKALSAALLSGSVTTALTALSGLRGAESLLAQKELVKKTLVARAKEIGLGIADEALEEGVDQLAQGIIAQQTYAPEKKIGDILSESLEAALIGGVLGGGMTALSEGVDALAGRKELLAEDLAAAQSEIENYEDATLDQTENDHRRNRAALAKAIARGVGLDGIEETILNAAGWTRKDKDGVTRADGSLTKIKDYQGPNVLDVDSAGKVKLDKTYVSKLAEVMPTVAGLVSSKQTSWHKPGQIEEPVSQSPAQPSPGAAVSPSSSLSPAPATPAPSAKPSSGEVGPRTPAGTPQTRGTSAQGAASVTARDTEGMTQAAAPAVSGAAAAPSPTVTPVNPVKPDSKEAVSALLPTYSAGDPRPQRAWEIANHLEMAGLDRPTANIVAANAIRFQGIVGKTVNEQVTSKEFNTFLDEQGATGDRSTREGTEPLKINLGNVTASTFSQPTASQKTANPAQAPVSKSPAKPSPVSKSSPSRPEYPALRAKLAAKEMNVIEALREVMRISGETDTGVLQDLLTDHLGLKKPAAAAAVETLRAAGELKGDKNDDISIAAGKRARDRQSTPSDKAYTAAKEFVPATQGALAENPAWARAKLSMLARTPPARRRWTYRFLTHLENSIAPRLSLYDALAVGETARKLLGGNKIAVTTHKGKITLAIDLDRMVADFSYLGDPRAAATATAKHEDIHAAQKHLERAAKLRVDAGLDGGKWTHEALAQQWRDLPAALQKVVWEAYNNVQASNNQSMPTNWDDEAAYAMQSEFLRMLVEGSIDPKAITEAVDAAPDLLQRIKDLLADLYDTLRSLIKGLPTSQAVTLDQQVTELKAALEQLGKPSTAEGLRTKMFLRDPSAVAMQALKNGTVFDHLATQDALFTPQGLRRVWDLLTPEMRAQVERLKKTAAPWLSKKRSDNAALTRDLLTFLLDPRAAEALAQANLTGSPAATASTGMVRRALRAMSDYFRSNRPDFAQTLSSLDLPTAQVLQQMQALLVNARAQFEAIALVQKLPTVTLPARTAVNVDEPEYRQYLIRTAAESAQAMVDAWTGEAQKQAFIEAAVKAANDALPGVGDAIQQLAIARALAGRTWESVKARMEANMRASREGPAPQPAQAPLLQSPAANSAQAIDEQRRAKAKALVDLRQQRRYARQQNSSPAAREALDRKLAQEQLAAGVLAVAANRERQYYRKADELTEDEIRQIETMLLVASDQLRLPETRAEERTMGFAKQAAFERLGIRFTPAPTASDADLKASSFAYTGPKAPVYVEGGRIIIKQSTLDDLAQRLPITRNQIRMSESEARAVLGLPPIATPNTAAAVAEARAAEQQQQDTRQSIARLEQLEAQERAAEKTNEKPVPLIDPNADPKTGKLHRGERGDLISWLGDHGSLGWPDTQAGGEWDWFLDLIGDYYNPEVSATRTRKKALRDSKGNVIGIKDAAVQGTKLGMTNTAKKMAREGNLTTPAAIVEYLIQQGVVTPAVPTEDGSPRNLSLHENIGDRTGIDAIEEAAREANHDLPDGIGNAVLAALDGREAARTNRQTDPERAAELQTLRFERDTRSGPVVVPAHDLAPLSDDGPTFITARSQDGDMIPLEVASHEWQPIDPESAEADDYLEGHPAWRGADTGNLERLVITLRGGTYYGQQTIPGDTLLRVEDAGNTGIGIDLGDGNGDFVTEEGEDLETERLGEEEIQTPAPDLDAALADLEAALAEEVAPLAASLRTTPEQRATELTGAEVDVQGTRVRTGTPVTFRFLHNKQSATKIWGKPKKDSDFDRGFEPSGRYVSEVTDTDYLLKNFPGQYDAGSLTFSNPIVIDGGSYGEPTSWKRRLSTLYGGTRGKRLSQAILADGYDGIITVSDRGNPSEILDLTTFDAGKALYAAPRLQALHNLSAENLIFADKMGGIAVPSMAVTPEGQGMSGFGNITLIGTRDLVDPAKEPVFDADAYSPRFPDPEFPKAKSKDAQKVVDDIRPFAKAFGDNSLTDSIWDNAVNRPRPGESVEKMQRSDAAKAAFLASQGIQVQPVMKDTSINYEVVREPAFQPFRENPQQWFQIDYNDSTAMQRLGTLVKDAELRKIDQLKAEPRIKDYLRKNAAAQLNEKGELLYGVWDRIGRDLKNLGTQTVDHDATRKVIAEAMQGKEAALKAWAEKLILPLHAAPSLTLKGRKVPYTLENIVEAMRGRVRGREDTMTFGEGTARAHISKRFKDLEQMRKAAREQIVPEAELIAARERAQKVLAQYREQVADYTTITNYRGNKDHFAAFDAAMRALVTWAKGKKDAATLARALRAEDFENVPDNVVQLGQRAAQLWLQAPVPYFEAKPQRAVGLDEFIGAVIPEGSPPEVTDILDKHGIRHRTYTGSTDAQTAVAAEFAQQLSAEGLPALFSAPRRAYQTMTFDPAFATPFGQIVSYHWMSKPIGGMEAQRVSDWSQARTNAITGRDIVHHFKVMKPDGMHTVSLETALGQLSDTQRKRLQGLIRAEQSRRQDQATGQMALFASGRTPILPSSRDVAGLRTAKDAWTAANYDEAQAEQIVDKFYKPAAFDSIPANAVLLPMPSTSGHNILPDLLAKRIAKQQGATIAAGQIGRATARTEAKKKTTFWAKMEDPVNYLPGKDFDSLLEAKGPIYLVEDVHNTGESWMAMRRLLEEHGITVAGVATLTATELRVTSPRDIERLSEKVASLTNTPLDETTPLLHGLFHDSYKQWFNKAERSATGDSRQASRLLGVARAHAAARAPEYRPQSQDAQEVSGRGSEDLVSPTYEQLTLFSAPRLEESAIQGYLDLPNVAVPPAKQPAAKRAIRAAGNVQGAPYLPASGGDAAARGRLDALRERAQRAWRGLVNQDVDALKEAFTEKDSFSTLIHDFVSREIPSFDIRGAIIQGPDDFAAFNLAVRSPYFESLKIAVLDSALQVVHSQIVHVGGLNEAVVDPKAIAGILATAKMLNPKAKLIGWMIAHNHPSGDPAPSDADKRVTKRLVAMGEMLGLPLMDHVVTNGQKYFSFRESGIIGSADIDRSIDELPKRSSKPKLSILPTPKDKPVSWGYPTNPDGPMADWEAIPSGSSIEISMRPERALPYLQALRTADPDYYHVLYLDTRLAIRAVERVPTNLTAAQLFQRIVLGAAREGAFSYTLGFPATPTAEQKQITVEAATGRRVGAPGDWIVRINGQFESLWSSEAEAREWAASIPATSESKVNENSDHIPTDQQRRLVRRLREQSQTIGLQFSDAMTVSADNYFSFAENGIMEEPALYASPKLRAAADTAARAARASGIVSYDDFRALIAAKLPQALTTLDPILPEVWDQSAQPRLALDLPKASPSLPVSGAAVSKSPRNVSQSPRPTQQTLPFQPRAPTIERTMTPLPEGADMTSLERAEADEMQREQQDLLEAADTLEDELGTDADEALDAYQDDPALPSSDRTPDQVFEHRLATAKAEILADMADGTMPRSVTRFADLHDHVDANLYVNDSDRPDRQIGPLGKRLGWKNSDYIAFTSRLIEALDQWLQLGTKNQEPDTKNLPASDRIAQAAQKTNTNPTKPQQDAENYQTGKVTVHGLRLSIENPRGSTRRGTDANGKAWEVTMPHHYGRILGTTGADKDHVDFFLGPNPTSPMAFVVNQKKPGNGHFDEHKVMLGFTNPGTAARGYLDSYSPGWRGYSSIVPMTLPQLKHWLDNGKIGEAVTKAPVVSIDTKPKPTRPATTHTFPDGYHLTGPGLHLLPASIRAYHGTPHEIDPKTGFSTSKIGTGEGAQVYGWGLYFAEAMKVAEQYRKALSYPIFRIGDKEFFKREGPEAFKKWAVGQVGQEWPREVVRYFEHAVDQFYHDGTTYGFGFDIASNRAKAKVRDMLEQNKVEEYRIQEVIGAMGRITDNVIDTTPYDSEDGRWTARAVGWKPHDESQSIDAKAYNDIWSRIGWYAASFAEAPARLQAEYEAQLKVQSEEYDRLRDDKGKPSSDPAVVEASSRIRLAEAALSLLKSGKVVPQANKRRGNLYTVDLIGDPAEFLDWDAPLGQQSQSIVAMFQWRSKKPMNNTYKKAFKKIHPFFSSDERTVREVYKQFAQDIGGSEKDASMFLAGMGIKGVRYTDGNSRLKIEQTSHAWEVLTNTGKLVAKESTEEAARAAMARLQTHNYVLFDDKLVRIIEKNGQPIDTPALASSDRQALPASPRQILDATSRASFNHLDRWFTGALARQAKRVTSSDPVTSATQAAAAWWNQDTPGVSTLRSLKELAQRELLPETVLPREIMSAMREMQIKQSMGQQKALDVGRALSDKPKFSDLHYPPEFVENPMHREAMFTAMEQGKVDTLPPALQEVARKLRQMLVEAGREAVKQGRMNPDTFEGLRTNFMPRFTKEEAQASAGDFSKRFKLGVKDILAQRSTAFHITDTSRKDKNGLPQIVSHAKGKWRFDSQQARDAYYEDLITRQTLDGELARNDMTWMNRGDARALRSITPEMLKAPATMTKEQRDVVARVQRQLRNQFKKEDPYEPKDLVKDPVYAVMRYLAQMTHDNAVAEFFNVIDQNPDWTSTTEMKGFTQIPDNDRFGALAGKFVRKDIADQVMELAHTPAQVIQLYDTLLRLWKTGKTVLNPATHARNIIGNLPFAQFAGNNALNPANWPHYAQALRTLRQGGDEYRQLYETGVLGADYASTELRAALENIVPVVQEDDSTSPIRHLIALGNRAAQWGKAHSLANVATLGSVGATAGFIAAGPLGALAGAGIGAAANPIYRGALWAYRLEDDLFKAAAFFKARSMGMTKEQAAQHVRDWFPYYDKPTSFTIKNLGGRSFIPFVSFYRESARIGAKALKERPLSLATTLAIPALITAYSAAKLGLDDEDKEDVKAGMRGKGAKLLGMTPLAGVPIFSMLIPWRTSSGQLQQLDLSSTHPMADFLANRVENWNNDPWWKAWGRAIFANPILGMVHAIGFESDPFSGRPLADASNTDSERLAALLNYAYKTALPPLAPGGTNWTMIEQSPRRIANKTLALRSPAQAVGRGILGIDLRNADPDIYAKAEAFRRRRGLPVKEENKAHPTDAAGRARKALFEELVQPQPSPQALAKLLQSLNDLGKPVRTVADVLDILDYRRPDGVINPKELRAPFRASLAPEARRVLDTALREFQRARAATPGAFAKARQAIKTTTRAPITDEP